MDVSIDQICRIEEFPPKSFKEFQASCHCRKSATFTQSWEESEQSRRAWLWSSVTLPVQHWQESVWSIFRQCCNARSWQWANHYGLFATERFWPL